MTSDGQTIKNPILKPLLTLEAFVKTKEAFLRGKNTVLLSGGTDGQKPHFAAAVSEATERPLLYVAANEQKAREICADLSFFAETLYYPARDFVFYSADVKSADIMNRRFSVLRALVSGVRVNVVITADALFDALIPRETIAKSVCRVCVGDNIAIDALSERLVRLGYERASAVEGAGQFAVRGGILDVFPSAAETAARIEFWGDEVDSVRVLDSYARRSVDKINEISIFPARELIFDEKTLNAAVKRMEDEYALVKRNFAEQGDKDEEILTLERTVGADLEKFKTLGNFSGADKYINFFYPEITTFAGFLPENTLVVFDEPARIAEHAKGVTEEFFGSMANRVEKGAALPSQMKSVTDYNEALKRLSGHKKLLFSSFVSTRDEFKIDEICQIITKSSVFGTGETFYDDLRFYRENDYSVVVLAGGDARCERLAAELINEGFSAHYDGALEKDLTPKTVKLTNGALSQGFEYPAAKFALISISERAAKKRAKRGREKNKNISVINSFADLKPGDYVVHDNHGIGVFRGVEKIVVDDVAKDYMKISYEGGGVLYAQPSQLDLIHKYIGGEEGARVKLNKLGGQEWQKAKARAKGAVEILAKDLIELYAKREASKGFAYSADNVWQKEFEEMFPYEETDDQLAAIEDVKRDMESPKIMDRLICGDVGYGKTEIAIRAAFKAVQDGKQAAYLVPTTILAQQHYDTFSQRMKNYPLNVDLLSRFRTKAEQKAVIDGIGKGAVDIVIGTHKILSESIKFHNLGLIIVDEEQRFGVSHKEKLKRMRHNADVLTLTATPIPRTLHMSLSGIRDMSVLSEPPHERRPVQTYVTEYSAELVRDAITRELARGGQVYYLHNRVRNIAETAARIKLMLPDASVGYAHGQMSERELENVMLDFVGGELDVLVCTTIIETGLDIPNVNTIIIQDSDYMGLAQLYQLRGRVGRSNRTSYAYLMYKKDKVLTEASEKRLQTIREFTEFGSGFKIAMRDLEIRGAGSLFGAEQSGHMEAVGYDLYRKLLSDALRALKAERGDFGGVLPDDYGEMFETQVDVAISAFIPPFFIADEAQKLEIYKKIALIRNETDYNDVYEEIEDRFGDLPVSAKNLLDVALVKALAHKAGAVSVIQKNNAYLVTFKPDANADPVKIAEQIKRRKGKMLFTAGAAPYVTLRGGTFGELREVITAII